ncbi:MAG: FRG domain-containing protein [Coriobacteriales bacterium]|nr:FRG domain-containing protein [Coriobacteriales bacterium]
MYKTVVIDDMFGISTLLMEQRYRKDLDRYRNLHIYRGMSNADFSMVSSLQRICKQKRRTLEPAILSNFTKYAVLEDPTIEESVWRQMILGQHHGLPTRLLDWSYSPLVGLHFATIENNLEDMDAHDSVVWRIDVKELHAMLPPKYQEVMARSHNTVFSLKMLQESCEGPEQYDKDMAGKAMLVVEPPSIEQRIINQYSFFTIVPLDTVDVVDFLSQHTERSVKYVIKKELRWRVRDMLDKLNVSERIMYPGLDGLSSWLARHFFVKETETAAPYDPQPL